MFVEPFSADGYLPSGIFLVHHHLLPKIYARVTSVHPSCMWVKVGDWVIFPANRTVDIKYSHARTVHVLSEPNVMGIVEAGDGLPWFAQRTSE
jgi:hypothetical protein